MSQPATAPTRIQPSAPPPSIHVRALITWIAIFPLVTLGFYAIAPFAEDWHPILRAFVLTLIVVPTAVYLVVPRLMRLHGKVRGRRR
ncbi:hypothetical protein ACF1AJ_10550 [Leifsonia sp. NPDC014704]|uniref:hypothetical protein n=1 Tax=Leifsonia sp. NPDC014704 TaxID=3364123 RepID=UPI0036F4A91F